MVFENPREKGLDSIGQSGYDQVGSLEALEFSLTI